MREDESPGDKTPTDPSQPVRALSELRALVRLRHRGSIKVGDVLYRAYVTLLFALYGFYLALGFIDGSPAGEAGISWIETYAPSWLGLGAAVALMAGVRSGTSGGPLALDPAELQHVLMTPIARRVALRSAVLRLLATAALLGAAAGLLAGELVQRRLPGSALAWLGSGTLIGLTIMTAAAGMALVAASLPVLRRRAWVGSVGAGALVVWATVDVVNHTSTAPTTLVGQMALWPVEFTWWALAAPIVAFGLATYGAFAIGGLSIERASRRSKLIRQVRFALAQQDIRSLILLRRQLGFERPRGRPYVRVSPNGLIARVPVLYRDLCSYLRWPVQRIVRVVALATVAGLAMAGAWKGTPALAFGYVAVSYLASLEMVEPFSQEIDHMSFLNGAPVESASVLFQHLLVATGAMTVWMLIVAAVSAATAASVDLLAVMALASLPAAGVAVAGGAISTKRVDAGDASNGLFMPDEIAGSAALFRIVWPVVLAGSGALPVIVAQRALERGDSTLDAARPIAVIVLIVASAMLGWIRMRDSIMESMEEASAQAKGGSPR